MPLHTDIIDLDIDLDRHQSALREDGWTVVPNVIAPDLLDAAAAALMPALARRDAIRIRNDVAENSAGTTHHLLMDDPCFIEMLLAFKPLDPLIKQFFDGNYILNSYGGGLNDRDTRAYVQNVHRDVRFWSDAKRFMLNALVMLDDFTHENGATHLLSGSQDLPERPADTLFFAEASRALGTRGSVLFFDSRVWHAAGINQTDLRRSALTLTFTNPFFKQQLDYPRMFGYENADRCDPWLRQVIGFNARVPASLEEFYVPTHQRFYQRGQD